MTTKSKSKGSFLKWIARFFLSVGIAGLVGMGVYFFSRNIPDLMELKGPDLKGIGAFLWDWGVFGSVPVFSISVKSLLLAATLFLWTLIEVMSFFSPSDSSTPSDGVESHPSALSLGPVGTVSLSTEGKTDPIPEEFYKGLHSDEAEPSQQDQKPEKEPEKDSEKEPEKIPPQENSGIQAEKTLRELEAELSTLADEAREGLMSLGMNVKVILQESNTLAQACNTSKDEVEKISHKGISMMALILQIDSYFSNEEDDLERLKSLFSELKHSVEEVISMNAMTLMTYNQTATTVRHISNSIALVTENLLQEAKKIQRIKETSHFHKL